MSIESSATGKADHRGGPDFLGIGSSRCGTTWLHSNLRRHPEIWLPPVKELHYFDRKGGVRRFSPRARRHARRLPRTARHLLRGEAKAVSDLRFFRRYLLGSQNRQGYRRWFDHPGWRATGEITPAYCTLSEEAVAEVAGLLPDVKLVFLMRDPIERAWSAAAKSLGRERNRNIADVPAEEIARKFRGRGFLSRADYLTTLDRWSRHYPEEQIFIGFLEEIAEDPAAFMERLQRFLGVAQQSLPPAELRRRVNDTSAWRSAVPPEMERELAAGFVDLTRELDLRFGSYATLWHERVRRALA